MADAREKSNDPIWYRVADRLGVPVLVICFTGVCMIWTAQWIAPQVERLLNGHIEFMHRTATSAEKTAEATKVNASIQSEIKTAVQEIKEVGKEQVDNTRESIKMHREVLDELKKQKVPSGFPQSGIQSGHLPYVLFGG